MAFCCRRVSKKWARVPASGLVVQSILQPWFAEGVDEGSSPVQLSDALCGSKISNIAAKIDAFQHGRPFSWVTRKWNLLNDTRDLLESFYTDENYGLLNAFHSGK